MDDLKIFDSHMHAYAGPRDSSWIQHIKKYLDNGEIIGAVCCSDLGTKNEDFEKDTQDLLEFAKVEGKKRVLVMAMVHLSDPDWKLHATKWFDKYPQLTGIKIKPSVRLSNYPIASEFIDPLFEFVNERDLIVVSHTEPGPGTSSVCFAESLNKFKETKLVLYHSSLHEDAVFMAMKYKNVYLEPSWLSMFPSFFEMAEKLCPKKIMAGTDGPGWFRSFDGSPYEDLSTLAKSMIKSEDVLKDFLSRTAQKFFGLE